MNTFQDPPHFDYFLGVGIKDHLLYSTAPLSSGKSRLMRIVRIMIFNFSCASNTIQHAQLCEKPQKIQADHSINAWIIDNMTNWLQFERLLCLWMWCTGAQGTLLSNFPPTVHLRNKPIHYLHSGRRGRVGQQTPFCSAGQHTEMELQHWGCLQEGTKNSLLLEAWIHKVCSLSSAGSNNFTGDSFCPQNKVDSFTFKKFFFYNDQ